VKATRARFREVRPTALGAQSSLYASLEQGTRGKQTRRRRAAARSLGDAPAPYVAPAAVAIPAADVVTWDEPSGLERVTPAPAPPAATNGGAPAPVPAPPPTPSTLSATDPYVDLGRRSVRQLGDLLSEEEVRQAVDAINRPRPRMLGDEQVVLDGFLDRLQTAPPVGVGVPRASESQLAALANVAALSGPPTLAPPRAVAFTGPLFQLTDSVGRGGANKPEDVRALKTRLLALGFNWLTADDTVDADTIEAIQLFQAIKNGHHTVKANAANDGLVEVGKGTYGWLQATNAPRWQLLPLGSAAEGYVNDERADTSSNYDYGTSWLCDAITAAGAEYKRIHLDVVAGAALMAVNDASLPRGIPQPGETVLHKGHQTGLEFDLRLPRTDGISGGVLHTDTLYDRNAMRAMLTALRTQSVNRIFFNDPTLVGEGLCQSTGGHDNHAHVEFLPPAQGPVEAAAAVPPEVQSLGAESFNYVVPDPVPAVGQPTPMTCWAAVGTMMASWRDKVSYPIQTVCDRAGGPYGAKFAANQGVTRAEMNAFMTALGLTAEAPACYTPRGLLALLQAHGPLWIIGDQDMIQNQLVHARVVTGMRGDGTEAGTWVRIVDPIGPKEYEETFQRLAERLEAPDAVQFELEVVHF
jgi:hypothetical protein